MRPQAFDSTFARGDRAHHAAGLDVLLDSAAAQFARHGLSGVSMKDIGREVGYTAPLICYHFANKDNLYLEAFQHKIDQTVDYIGERVASMVEPALRFRALVEALYDLFMSDCHLLALVQRDIIDATLGQRTLLSRRQYLHFTSMIRRLASDLTGAAITSQTAFSVASLVFGYCMLSSVRMSMGSDGAPLSSSTDRDALVREAVNLVRGAARG